ncbi:hypothetical protein [Caldithrix abyssi]
MISRFLLFILLFFSISCDVLDYQPDSENFHHIEKPEPITVYLGVDLPTDTLCFWSNVDLHYVLVSKHPSFRLKKIQVYIDDQPVRFSHDPGKQIITLFASGISTGFHRLKIECYLSSGSNSLADRMGLEGYVISREYPAIFDNRYFTGDIEVYVSVNSDNLPVLTWNVYPYHNFQQYQIMRIYRYYKNDYSYTEYRDTLTVISRRTLNRFIDSTYFGGFVRYWIVVQARGEKFQSNVVDLNTQFDIALKVENTSEGNLHLQWQKLPIQKGFQRYVLKMAATTYNETLLNIRTTAINNLEQTEFVDTQATFGLAMYYLLNVQINEKEYPLTAAKFFKGQQTSYIHRADYIPYRGDFCLLQQQTNRYFTSFFTGSKFTSSGDRIVNFSPDGKWAFRKTNSSDGAVIYRVSPLEITRVLETIQLRNQAGIPPLFVDFLVSNKGWLIFHDTRSWHNMVYDVPNKRLLLDLSDKDYGAVVQASINGDYLLFENKSLYKINGDMTLKKLFSLDSDVSHFTFSQNPDQIIFTSNKSLSIYQVENKQLVQSFPLEADLFYPVIDRYRGLLGGFTKGRQYFRIYSLNDGHLVKEIPIAFDENYLHLTRFYFHKNTLFYSEKWNGASIMKIIW